MFFRHEVSFSSEEVDRVCEEIAVSEESIDSSILIVSKMMLPKGPAALKAFRLGLNKASSGSAFAPWRWRRSRPGRR